MFNMKMALMASIAPLALASVSAHAAGAPSADAGGQKEAASPAVAKKAFTTGVAKGRDLLDSAISASALDDTEIEKLGARSLSEIVRTIPGIRAEAGSGEGDGSFTIRGLPMAATGAKYLQFQEDGLPVLEFGDMTTTLGPDLFLRADLNLSQIQTIRGGSASTFASNAPGGVINLISKTGETEGGTVELTTGLDYGMKRVDMEYGGKLSDTLRFHVGGFYRQGEGPRDIGYDAFKGGQIKFNVTKDFEGGYIRFYGKYLNDRTPDYVASPLHVSGTNSSPDYTSIPGFDIKRDAVLSRNITAYPGLDDGNNRAQLDMRNGLHPIVKAGGVEAQYDFQGWTITEKFRYEANSGTLDYLLPLTTAPAGALAFAFGGPGATLSYATGPHTGQVITNPAALNGNGLMSLDLAIHENINSLDNLTNDLRVTRTWSIGGGTLTTTAGVYDSRQTLDTTTYFATPFADVLGGGNSSLINITTATGIPQTQAGIFSFSLEGSPFYRRSTNVDYAVDAPYASVNYHINKLSVGGSLRYDLGSARGNYNGAELGGGRFGVGPFDINGDGVISPAESRTAFLPLSNPAPVNYDWHYLSYSAGVNYRFSEGLAVFGRYSRGGRAQADRVLFNPGISLTTGDLIGSKGYDPVKQAEVGVKFRRDTLALNLTGFWASTNEQNTQLNTDATGALQLQNISREYQAYGLEFEGDYSMGPFKLAAGWTYTSAEIKQDLGDPAVVGNTPRHQPSFMYSITPQYETEHFTVGANFTGVTESYAEDVNQLKMPGYTTVNAFVQYRPVERVQLSVNANNLFNTLGLTEVTQGAIPAGGTVFARAINGRTVSASLRLSF